MSYMCSSMEDITGYGLLHEQSHTGKTQFCAGVLLRCPATYSCARFWPNALKQIPWAQHKTQHPLMGPVLTHQGLAALLAFTTVHQNLQVPRPRPTCDRHERIWTIKSSSPLSEIGLVSWALSSCWFKRTSSVQQECIGSSRVMTDINTINHGQPFTFSRPKSNWEPLGCVSESEAIK